MQPYLWRHGEEHTCPQVPRARHLWTMRVFQDSSRRTAGLGNLARGVLEELGEIPRLCKSRKNLSAANASFWQISRNPFSSYAYCISHSFCLTVDSKRHLDYRGSNGSLDPNLKKSTPTPVLEKNGLTYACECSVAVLLAHGLTACSVAWPAIIDVTMLSLRAPSW